MKSFLIFISGFFTALILLMGGGYAFMQYTESVVEEYQAEWLPDFDKELYKSAAELAVAKTEYERWVALGNVGLWNVDIGALKNAEDFANENLTLAKKYKNDWNYGNAIHKGHLTLGRVALRRNNIEEAKKQLILAGKTPGSPQLDSFGPNMILAKELLEKGEMQAVLTYFELCEEFWSFDMGQIMKWEDIVLNGEIPNFSTGLIR